MRDFFAQMRRGGFGLGISVAKLTKAMVEALVRLPPAAAPSKEVVVGHLGLLGQMSKTRDINAAWSGAKRQVAGEHPEKFWLDGKVLRRGSTMEHGPREKLSAAGLRKLAALAVKEGVGPDEILRRLMSAWRRAGK